MDKIRQERINAEVQKVIASALSEMRDPKVSSMTSIMEAKVTNDLSYCDLYFSIMGDEREKKETMEALKNASGYLRSHIAKNMALRIVPEIRIHEDETLDHAARVNELLNSIKKENDEH